jgi:hypothetical protein
VLAAESSLSFAQDIAIVTGAEFIAKDLGMKVESTVVEQLGAARKVTCSGTSTTLIADAATKEEIDMRIAQLKKELAETDSVYDTEKLSERIAKLSGGVAVVKVRGGGYWRWQGGRKSGCPVKKTVAQTVVPCIYIWGVRKAVSVFNWEVPSCWPVVREAHATLAVSLANC